MVATEGNNIIVYKITKLIYGRFPGKTLRQWDSFAGVTGAPKTFEEGKEVTLYVYREYQRKDGTVICGIHFGASDENDKRILDIVKSGTHLLPGKGPHNLAFYIRNSQRVVRAKLVKLDDVASHWDVSQTVCSSSKSSSGTPVWRVVPKRTGTIARIAREKQPRISLSMTPWRLRAEAIVRAQAPQQTDPKQTEKQIQEEFNRLASTDLKIGREAILFIRPNDDPAEKAPSWPAFVFPADPDDRGYLDQLAKKIRGIIERGAPSQMGMDRSSRDAAPGADSTLAPAADSTLVPGADSRLAQEFSRATAVVRARMIATEDNNHIIVYRITKLIYGRFPGKTLRQWDGFVGVRGWRKIFEEGKEVTLYVYREYQRKDGTVICGVHFNVSDEGDKRILEIVKSGTHLLPGKGPHNLVFHLRNSQRVVRAKLVKLDDVASHWDVSETVCSSSKSSSGTPVWRVVSRNAGAGKGIKENQPRITLSMTPWRLRAEAIVRAQAPQQTDPKQTEKQIQEEFNRLVSTDLKIGRGAILFLRPNDDPAEKAPSWPAFVFPADPDNRGYLDQLAKKIRGIIERGEREGLNL